MVDIKDWEKVLKETKLNKQKGIVVFNEKGTITKGEKILLETKKKIEEAKKTGYIRIYEKPLTKKTIEMDF